MTVTSQNKEKLNDYEGFVEKFKRKPTTDDCYTPQAVYDEVVKWVDEKIMPLEGMQIVRPFWPDTDYQNYEYPENAVVIDNPPFSILSKICRWYSERGIKYFLFAPALTLFATPTSSDESFIVVSSNIVFENGAVINISFRTNMLPGIRVKIAGDLNKRLKEAQKQEPKTKASITYPNNVITSAILGRIATRGVCAEFKTEDCSFVRKLDNQKGALYGGGYLLSERAAAERAAAERAAAERAAAERAAAERADAERVILSERELNLIKSLGKKEERK